MSTRPPIGLDTSQAPELHGRNPTAEEYRERIDLLTQCARDGNTNTAEFEELSRLARSLTFIVECRRQQVGNLEGIVRELRARTNAADQG